MNYCSSCSQALQTTPKLLLGLKGTAKGRHVRLWRRSYPEFKQSAASCRFCAEIDSYHHDPTVHGEMKDFFELSEDEHSQAYVELALFAGRRGFPTLNVFFNFNSPLNRKQHMDEDEDCYMDASQASEDDDSSSNDRDFMIGYALAVVEEIPAINTLQPLYLSCLRFWMQRCLGQHHRCRVANPRGWLPKRLLDVGLNPSNSTIRLLSSEEVSAGSPYVALSHRWNDTHMPKLTSNHTVDFDVNSFPSTFQEAIELTRELGLRYLWIDSLCINQNDPDDWEVQSAQMSMVYEHSICNFAATGASTSGKGLYSSVEWQARHGAINTFGVDCSWNATNHSNQFHYLIRHSRFRNLDRSVDHNEINKRGWVFQERLLSPRTVHFATETLHWECRESSSLAFVSSHGLHDLDFYATNGSFSNKNWAEQTRQAMSKFVAGRGSLAEAYNTWIQMRRIYSSTEVTYSSDKLVALSSVAAAFEPLFGDNYHAGIWRRTAVYDLLWQVSKPSRRSHHGAPSWSWASMEDGNLLWPQDILPRYPHDTHELARVVRVETTPYSPHNPTGRVSSGIIELQCFGLLFDPVLQGFSIDFLEELHADNGLGSAPSQMPPIEVRFDEAADNFAGQQIVCLLLVLENNMVASGGFTLYGLIVANQGDGTYRRIGYFGCYWAHDNVSDLHWYLDLLGPASDHDKGNFYDLVVLR